MPPEVDELRESLRAAARAAYPNEACGAIVREGKRARFVPIANVAAEPQHYFRMDWGTWAGLVISGVEILAVWHSHCGTDAEPTMADRVGIEDTRLPYLIYATPADAWSWTEPSGWEAPLLQRPFVHGSLDCYGLVRDWYRLHRGLVLPNIYRRDAWWIPTPELPAENLYLDHVFAAGFTEVDRRALEPGDMLLIELGIRHPDPARPRPNHAAVWLGKGEIIHHPPGGLSRVQPYVANRGAYARGTVLAVRPPGGK